jgi:hypothetical protein
MKSKSAALCSTVLSTISLASDSIWLTSVDENGVSRIESGPSCVEKDVVPRGAQFT